jgi:hypothetical protein
MAPRDADAKQLKSGRSPLSRVDPVQVGVFGASAAFTLVVALPGGSTDIIVRHQIGIVTWFALGLGVAAGLLPRARLPLAAAAPAVLLTLLAVWAAAGLAWSGSAERTEVEIARLTYFIGVLLLWLAVLDRRSWRAAAGGLAAGMAAICAVALASRLWPAAFPADYVSRIFGFRLSYPLQYWNALGAWAALTATMGVAWSAHARSSAVRAAALGSVPIAGLVIYLTFSRGALVAALVGTVAACLLGRNRWLSLVHGLAAAAGTALAIGVVRSFPELAEGSGGDGIGIGATLIAVALGGAGCASVAVLARRMSWGGWRPRTWAGRRAAISSGLVVATLLTVAVASGVPARAWDEFQDKRPETPGGRLESRLGSASGSGRVEYWRTALAMFESHPLRGAGFGAYEFSWDRQARSPATVQDGHSLYLETLAEGGIVGLVLLLLALGALLVLVLRTHFRHGDRNSAGASAGLIAAYLAFLAHAGIDWLWESTAVAVVAISGGAILLASDGRSGARALAIPARVVAGLISLAAMLVMLPSLVSTSAVRDSQEHVRSGDLRRAFSDATHAVETRPWAATPYVQRALISERTNDLTAAERDLRRARGREPDNWEIPLLLARVYAQHGSVRLAIHYAREARALRPKARALRPKARARRPEARERRPKARPLTAVSPR